MIGAIAKRLGAGLVLVALVAAITFFGTSRMERRPESYLLGANATQEDIDALHRRLGLDEPLVVQFGNWAKNAVRGDFGQSWRTTQDVSDEIAPRIVRTGSLLAIGMVLALVVGITIGLAAGTRPGQMTDKVATGTVTLLQSLPEFWLAIVLITVVALQLKWLPASGYVPFDQSPSRWFRSIILPSLALGLPSAAAIARHVRSATVAELGQEYVRVGLAAGFSRRFVAYRMILRNVLSRAVAIVGLQVVVMLSVSVVTERVFSIPGLGTLVLDAATQQDVPVMLAGVMVFSIAVLLVNLLVDVGQAALDPRVRLT